VIKKKSFVDTVVKFLISSFIIFIVLIPVLIVRTVGKIFKKDLIKFNQDKERGKYSQWMFDTWLSEKEKAQNNRVFVYFLFPSLFSFSLFVVLPFFQGLYYSLTDWTGLNTGDEALVGILNYITIFRDYGFAYSFIRTVIYSVLNIVAINLIAFTLAMIVVQKLKFKNVYRAAFFMPNLIGGLVLGYIWQFVFNKAIVQFGGIFSSSLLIDGDKALFGLIIVVTWQYAGYIMMIYIAALQNVPQDLTEASKIDGANAWQRLRTITFPMISQAFTIAMFLTLTTSFKQYDTVVSLTQGGPPTQLPLWLSNIFSLTNQPAIEALDFLAVNIYDEAFVNFNMGVGQAKAITFFVVLLLVSLVQVYYNKRKEVEL
jgi:raffinose/stachyose/melibiose transport system permease protein